MDVFSRCLALNKTSGAYEFTLRSSLEFFVVHLALDFQDSFCARKL